MWAANIFLVHFAKSFSAFCFLSLLYFCNNAIPISEIYHIIFLQQGLIAQEKFQYHWEPKLPQFDSIINKFESISLKDHESKLLNEKL